MLDRINWNSKHLRPNIPVTPDRFPYELTRAYYSRGYVHESMGRSREAREDFRAALRIAEKTDDGDLADAAELHLADLARRCGTARVDVDGRRTQR